MLNKRFIGSTGFVTVHCTVYTLRYNCEKKLKWIKKIAQIAALVKDIRFKMWIYLLCKPFQYMLDEVLSKAYTVPAP
jgi:hypothetical protein